MKRIISMIILAVIVIAAAVPAMAGGCDFRDTFGDHDWYQTGFNYPTCTSDGYYVLKCHECGYAKKERNGSAYGHSWDLVSETDATCTEKGKASYYCIECGESRSETTKALGHKYKVLEVIKEATCISSGTEKVKCSRCNKITTRETDTTDHKYGEWEISVPATDSAKGQRARKCNHCGKEQSEEYYPDGTLYRGISDKEAVKVLQTRLSECGYLNDSIDGIFGKKTEQAVKGLQSKAGFSVDGIAWPQSNKQLEKEWQQLKGVVAEEAAPEAVETEAAEEAEAIEFVTSEYPFCTRIENEDGTFEVGYCARHLAVVNTANKHLESSVSELMSTKLLLQVREMYQTELNALYAEWLEASAEEERAGVVGAQSMFTGYLNAQEMIWKKQYGERSEEALTKINDMLLNQCVEVCSILEVVAE